ncbi:hypothetical protein KUTeg_004554 [Tegillarca granosa]|uniref:Uncharacterized protein n=1 Tax=Tegillarca granosa TaxID=220873 RepID=A0ABQ9FQD5_TEGGR|nr:hypothetical protein KUTeg_004554 [Tegillarca granosa]
MSAADDKNSTAPYPERQKYVTSRIWWARLTVIVTFCLGYYFISPPSPRLETAVDRLVYALKWQTISIFAIFIGIRKIGNTRFSTAAIDPVYGNAEHLLEVPKRYLQNTMEQFILHFVAQLVLSTYLSPESMQVVPLLALMFLSARIIFFIGYQKSPMHRAFGFALTMVPTLFTYMYCLFCLIYYDLKCNQLYEVFCVTKSGAAVDRLVYGHNTRWSTAAIDPVYGNAEHKLEVPKKYLAECNGTIHSSFYGPVSADKYLSPESMQVIPLLVLMFLSARIIFLSAT